MATWGPETLDIIRDSWQSHTPDLIAELVNAWHTENAKRRGYLYWPHTTAAGVMYQAAKLGLISRQRAATFHKRVKKLRARQHYIKQTIRDAVFQRDGHKCLLCGSIEDLELDHIVPVIDGGRSEAENLQTLCRKCHAKAKGSSKVDFRKPFVREHCKHCHQDHYRNLSADELDSKAKEDGLRSV